MSGNRKAFDVSENRKDLVTKEDKISFVDFPKDMVQLVGSFITDNDDKANYARVCKQVNNFFQPDLDKQELEKLLSHVADGEKDKAKKMLEANPRLVLQAANVTTMGGLTLKRVTPYECALACGDPDMALMVGEYFEKIAPNDTQLTEECKKLREEQFKRYEKAIDNMLNVKPYDIKSLIDIIKRSSKKDITEELATDTTDNKYNPDYKSELRTALEAFRKAFAPRELKTPEKQIEFIGFIYESISQVFELHNKEWDALSHNGADYDKNRLVWRQLLFPERRLPTVDRQAFAQDVDEIKNLHDMKRSLTYKYGSKNEFPPTLLDDSRSGLGFDFAVSIYGGVWGRLPCPWAGAADFKNYVEQKQQALKKLSSACENQMRITK